MEGFLAWFLFFLKLVLIVVVIGLPMLLVVIFVANFIYKRLNLDKLKDQSKP